MMTTITVTSVEQASRLVAEFNSRKIKAVQGEVYDGLAPYLTVAHTDAQADLVSQTALRYFPGAKIEHTPDA